MSGAWRRAAAAAVLVALVALGAVRGDDCRSISSNEQWIFQAPLAPLMHYNATEDTTYRIFFCGRADTIFGNASAQDSAAWRGFFLGAYANITSLDPHSLVDELFVMYFVGGDRGLPCPNGRSASMTLLTSCPCTNPIEPGHRGCICSAYTQSCVTNIMLQYAIPLPSPASDLHLQIFGLVVVLGVIFGLITWMIGYCVKYFRFGKRGVEAIPCIGCLRKFRRALLLSCARTCRRGSVPLRVAGVVPSSGADDVPGILPDFDNPAPPPDDAAEAGSPYRSSGYGTLHDRSFA